MIEEPLRLWTGTVAEMCEVLEKLPKGGLRSYFKEATIIARYGTLPPEVRHTIPVSADLIEKALAEAEEMS